MPRTVAARACRDALATQRYNRSGDRRPIRTCNNTFKRRTVGERAPDWNERKYGAGNDGKMTVHKLSILRHA
jgi:hypothetical protein